MWKVTTLASVDRGVRRNHLRDHMSRAQRATRAAVSDPVDSETEVDSESEESSAASGTERQQPMIPVVVTLIARASESEPYEDGQIADDVDVDDSGSTHSSSLGPVQRPPQRPTEVKRDVYLPGSLKQGKPKVNADKVEDELLRAVRQQFKLDATPVYMGSFCPLESYGTSTDRDSCLCCATYAVVFVKHIHELRICASYTSTLRAPKTSTAKAIWSAGSWPLIHCVPQSKLGGGTTYR